MSATASSIADAGGAFYFNEAAIASGKEAGLDGFRLYLIGRGGVMGDVSPAVVQSAFGYFNPELVANLWSSGIQTLSATKTADLYWECAAEFGRSRLGEVEGLAGFIEAAEAIVAAADRDGLPLFAGIAAMPLAEDLPGRAYQLTAVLRELRGSAHLCAVRSVGLVPREAHAHKRPEMVASFGWENIEAGPDVADKLAEAEELTNRALVPTYSVLTDAQSSAFAAGAVAIAGACS